MRDINRIDKFCDELKDIWKLHPDMRFGQMILNVFPDDPALYYIEDEKVMNELHNFYKGV